MQIKYKTEFYADILALDAALRSINLPEFSSVSFEAKHQDGGVADYTIYVNLKDCNELIEEKRKAIDDIVSACRPNWDFARKDRSKLFLEADWRIQRAMDDGDDITPLIAYRRALRDITKQESPSAVVWPEKPW